MKRLIKILSQNFLAVVLVLGIAFFLNFFASRLALRWDLTEEKEFSLSPATVKLMDQLKDRLTLKLYYSDDLPPQLLDIKQRSLDLFRELQGASKTSVILEHVDPAPNEDKERETMMQGILPLNADIIEKDKRVQKKFYMGVALYYQDRREIIPTVVQVDQLEYDLALRLVKLTQDTKPKMALILPPGKQNLYQGIRQFLGEFAEVTDLTSDAEEIKIQNPNAVVIVEPHGVSPKLLSGLDLLIEGGTHVLLFAGRVAVSDKMQIESVETGLGDWLDKKGIELGEKLVLDTRQNAEAPVSENFMGFAVQRFVAYPFWPVSLQDQLNRDFTGTSGLENLVFPWTNSLQIKADVKTDWQITPLASTSKTAFLQQDKNPGIGFDYAQNMTEYPTLQEFPLSVWLKNPKQKNSGQIFVTANFHMLRDQMLRTIQPNAIFLQNLFEYASAGNNLIGIRSRGKTDRPLREISDTTKNTIKLGHVFAIPALATLCGLLGLYGQKKRRARLIGEILRDEC